MSTKTAFTNEDYNWYQYYFYYLADPRTNSWPLVGAPQYILAIVAMYLYIVISLGPKLMNNRAPFQLKRVLIVYNFLQVTISVYIFLTALNFIISDGYSLLCQPMDYSRTPSAMRLATLGYVFYLAKISEFLDTIFFVLRKKSSQVTFLHMYHHTVMPLYSWFYVTYIPGGHAYVIPLVNAFVHIIMYFYYMMAATGPQFQKYLWWKKYITNLQLAQFVILFLHNFQLLFYECDYPKWTIFITLPGSFMFYKLFASFYKQSYVTVDKGQKLKNK